MIVLLTALRAELQISATSKRKVRKVETNMNPPVSCWVPHVWYLLAWFPGLELAGGRGQCLGLAAGEAGTCMGLALTPPPSLSLFSAPTDDALVRNASLVDVTWPVRTLPNPKAFKSRGRLPTEMFGPWYDGWPNVACVIWNTSFIFCFCNSLILWKLQQLLLS